MRPIKRRLVIQLYEIPLQYFSNLKDPFKGVILSLFDLQNTFNTVRIYFPSF